MNRTYGSEHRRTRSVLAVITAVVSALGVVSILPAVFVPGMFGPADTHGDALTTAAVSAIVSFPLVCAASIISSWLLWRARRNTAAFAAMTLPPLGVLLLMLVLLWLSY